MCGGGRLMLSFLHLTVFGTLLRLKSVTQAAEALDLPQPTLSRHLKYLRSHFDNPLFVRTSKGLEPTAMAMSIAGAISDALEIYAKRLSADHDVDPSDSHRNFLIAATDIGHLLTLPWLEDWAQKTPPHVSFTAVPLGRSRLVAQMAYGGVDVAIGSFPNLVEIGRAHV